MYKTDFSDIVIVSDLDGTFLNENSKEHPKNVEAVCDFIASGGHFTIASGRVRKNIPELVPSFRKICNAPLILGNGSMICSGPSLEIEKSLPLGKEAADEVIEYTTNRFPDFFFNTETEPDENGNKDAVVYKMAYYNENPDRVSELANCADERFGEKYWCGLSAPVLFEVLNKEATKGNGVAFIRSHFKDNVRIIAVGDYDNDIGLLESADIAACPENAAERVKAICDVFLCDHKEGCIANLINKLDRGEIKL